MEDQIQIRLTEEEDKPSKNHNNQNRLTSMPYVE